MITRKNEQISEVREKMRGGDGTAVLTALVAEKPANVRLFSRIVLSPGSSIGEHIHENETELFCFMSGTGEVSDDGNVSSVGAGDAMATFNGHSHSVKNIGSEDLVILAAIVKD